MRVRSWLAALFAAIASFFGFGSTAPAVAQPIAHADLHAQHIGRMNRALHEMRVHNRVNTAVIPPFHKVRGKTRAFLRPKV